MKSKINRNQKDLLRKLSKEVNKSIYHLIGGCCKVV